MSRREKITWLLIGAVFLVGFLSLIPAHYQICETNQYTEKEHCASYQLVPFALIKVGKFFEYAGAAVTALATVAIAWFTWTLKRSTDKLWEAGEKQLKVGAIAAKAARRSSKTAERAFTKLERPYVFVLGGNKLLQDPSFIDVMPPFIRYQVANYGKTPAIIQRVLAVTNIGKAPGVPVRVPNIHDLVAASIIAPNDTLSDLTEDLPPELKVSHVGPIYTAQAIAMVPHLEEGEWLFFKIVIRYRGAFSLSHETSACWRWDDETKSMVRYGGEEQNYVH